MVNSFVAEVLVMFLTKSFSVNWENERLDVLRGWGIGLQGEAALMLWKFSYEYYVITIEFM